MESEKKHKRGVEIPKNHNCVNQIVVRLWSWD